MVNFTGRFRDKASSTVLNALKATDSGKQADHKGESCSGWRKDVVILCLEFAEHGGCSRPTSRSGHDSWKRSVIRREVKRKFFPQHCMVDGLRARWPCTPTRVVCRMQRSRT